MGIYIGKLSSKFNKFAALLETMLCVVSLVAARWQW